MGINGRVGTLPGNTPITDIPPDYFPKGCGFWFKIPEGRDHGKKMFFRDSRHGKGAPKRTIVFVHGNPECSYIYRKIIQDVIDKAKKPFRIIAMDHIGFGLSDQASYEMVCMDHAENLLQLIRHLKPTNITLVIHDWGGPIGVGAFLREPGRVSNLVLNNTTIFPMPESGYTYRNYPIPWLPWSRFPLIMPNFIWGAFSSYAIYRTPTKPLNIIAGFVIQVAKYLFGILARNETPAQRIFREQFKTRLNARSSMRFVRQSAVWGHGNTYYEPSLGSRDTAPFYRFMQDNIKKLWGPKGRHIGARALLGRWDPLGKDEVIKQWTDNLPQLEGHVRLFNNVGHFIEEVKPREIAEAIIDVSKL
ncbi:MAG: alpha/beta fold hydrolase [Spirochaetes bacterium]|nr:alpha/beta fold hydrolase [Spirochaetota bacterium]